MYNAQIMVADHVHDSMNTDQAGIMTILGWLDKRGWTKTQLIIASPNDQDETYTGEQVEQSLEMNV